MEDTLFFPLAIDMIKKGGYGRVLDLGCGDGIFLRKLCQAIPEVTALGVDLAREAVEDGNRKAERDGLTNRVRLYRNDISKLTETPEALQGVQASTAFFVLHELLYTSEQRVVEFLSNYKRLLPEAPLIVFEAIRPPAEQMRKRPGISVFYYDYHDLSHQKPASREKWRELFDRAGFEHVDERFLNQLPPAERVV